MQGRRMSEEIKLEHVNPLLKDYEILIRTLSEQLEFYKEEQNHLKSEVVNLLDENKLLSSNIRQLLDAAQSVDPPITHRYEESDFVQNLKSQISLLVQEKESAIELWKNSLSTIDQLEEELKLFEGRTHGYVSKSEFQKMKSEYDRQMKELEIELIKSKSSLLKSRQSYKSAIEFKESELKKAFDMQETMRKEIQKLEEEVRKMQREQDEVRKIRNQLAEVLEDKNKTINELRIKETESKAKVTEAVEVVEVALMEKDSAIHRENLAKEELSKISKALNDVIDGTNEKLKSELEGTKKQYNDKLLKIKSDMKVLLDQLKEKDVELDKHKSTSKMLEEELDRMRRGVVLGNGNELSKFLNVEKSLESTFQKLLSSEKRNVQLETENSRMKEDLDKINSDYKDDVAKREAEKIELQLKITNLQKELEVSNKNLKDVAGKVEEVNGKISQIEAELKKQLDLKDQQAQEMLSSKIKEIEKDNTKANNELQEQLDLHVKFNQKWKVEVRNITQSLEDHIHQLRSEASELKQTNAELSEKLAQAEKQVEMYQQYLQRFCLDLSNVVALTKGENNTGQQ